MPVCTAAAAALIPMTKRAKICVFGVPVNFVMPNRLAEEYAMLDVMSGGRLEIAFPLGTGMEYWSNSVVNPASARAKFRESIDIMIQAWTEEGPTTYDGEFYNYRYLNVWPRPYQQPYPRCYIVGTGSPETIAFAAERGWGYASVFVPIKQQVKTFNLMRETMPKHGHEMTPDKAMANTIVYVAETNEIAEKEADGAHQVLLHRRRPDDAAVPGPAWLHLARSVPHSCRRRHQDARGLRLGRDDEELAGRRRHTRARGRENRRLV